MTEHFSKLGVSLTGAVKAFNDTLGSFKSRVLPAARELGELGVSGQKEIAEILRIDKEANPVSAPPEG
jgi:DNA recombination protein RmuC